ncbi:MAG TPA: hypothetical protein VGY57_06585 [Vicinamibacterales bacterium]|jgi:hypothetical protein|nr:hypothetical protein [Vicinamibacterales bacterium]
MKAVVKEINKVLKNAVGADLIPKRKRLRVLLRSAKALCENSRDNGEGLYLVRPAASARRRRRRPRKK